MPATTFGPTGSFVQQWGKIKDAKAPFPNTGNNSFGNWFNYLWEESRLATTTFVEQSRLSEAFLTVLEQKSTGFAPVANFPYMLDSQKLKVLSTFLSIGFKRVALDGVSANKGRSVREDEAVNGAEVFASHMKYAKTPGAEQHSVHLGFRSDGRDYATLVTQGGFSARARCIGQAVHGEYGLDQPWNPFSQPANAHALFLRKGINKDNCLHTVVSVSTDFTEIWPYPLLSDASLFPFANTPFAQWTPQMEQEALAHKFNVRTVRLPNTPNRIDHVETQLKVYILRMNDSKAFSTEKWQKEVGVTNPFPEGAVDKVRKEDILGEVVLTRWHFFCQDAQGKGDLQLYHVEFDDKQDFFRPDADDLRARFGDTFPELLRAEVVRMVKGGVNNNLVKSKELYAKQLREENMPARAPVAKKVCSFCNKSFITAKLLEDHIPKCPSNPNRVATGFAPIGGLPRPGGPGIPPPPGTF